MLIDDRFGESKVRQLLPRWWSITTSFFRSAS
jgi:Rad3-related DNA helicase